MTAPSRIEDATCVIPLRWADRRALDEITGYLRWLSTRLDVIVVDGSPPPVFDRHHSAWAPFLRHLPPDPDLDFVFGKVNGVTTGVRKARGERIVLADDDVRYDDGSLAQVVAALEGADLVRPQNYFDPLPWHGYWDTARTLLNRMTGGDFPGTLAVRRSTFLRTGGYDGDVLFENLELERTVRAAGGRVIIALDCFVHRLPPTTAHFWSQRVRQAYDEFARPARLVGWLAAVPLLASCIARRRFGTLAVGAGVLVAVAELGRRRAGGTLVFPWRASLFAPLWCLERSVCAWLAIMQRLRRGGVVYGDTVITRAATPTRQLRRRLSARASVPGPPRGRSLRRSPVYGCLAS